MKTEKVILLPLNIEDFNKLKEYADKNNRTTRRQAQFIISKWIQMKDEEIDNNLSELDNID